MSADPRHRLQRQQNGQGTSAGPALIDSPRPLYAYTDHDILQPPPAQLFSGAGMGTLEELLERDRRREQDGFPRKIKLGRFIKPGKGNKNAIIVVPTTVEEKLVHDNEFHPESDGEAGGSGEGEPGEVIGEQPVREPSDEAGEGAGQGQGGGHDTDSNAYDLGRILTEKFELPNLFEKGSKRSLTRVTYDITDCNRGFGQVLDKKATLLEVLKTNFALGRIPDINAIDTTELLVSPGDRMYRVLSKEKDFESQAVVFFVRDYSGSMAGKCTELIVAQHILIYSWLLYQYSKRVETRFILHDTDAREVPDFHSYYSLKVAGGTQVSAAYELVNKIVETENLAQEYNVYVFQGTDGDDWDTQGDKAIPELRKMLGYASRVGITISEHSYSKGQKTEVAKYLEKSGLLTEQGTRLRLDLVDEDADESRLIEGIKKLTTAGYAPA